MTAIAEADSAAPAFERRLAETDPGALRADRLTLLQVNIGLRCNTACSHCHQSCSPQSTEIMDDETLATVCDVAGRLQPDLVDITGGSPELHPGLRRLVECLCDAGLAVQVRTNLSALLEPEAEGLVGFMAKRGVTLLASLPSLTAEEYALQRSQDFEAALDMLRTLNEAGWGRSERLTLNLAVNADACASESAEEARTRYRRMLGDELGINFDGVALITNVPVGRFRRQLERAGELPAYLAMLEAAFNPTTTRQLSCRTSIEIAWDGALSDCDFNLGAGLMTAEGECRHVRDFDIDALSHRRIRFADHCWACTADAGSS